MSLGQLAIAIDIIIAALIVYSGLLEIAQALRGASKESQK